jgi:hypothetical protein
MRDYSKTKRAMANIWNINVSPVDGIKYLEMLLTNIDMFKSIPSLAEYIIEDLESVSLDEREEDNAVSKERSVANFLDSSCSSRRSAYGNIWDFKTYSSAAKTK